MDGGDDDYDAGKLKDPSADEILRDQDHAAAAAADDEVEKEERQNADEQSKSYSRNCPHKKWLSVVLVGHIL